MESVSLQQIILYAEDDQDDFEALNDALFQITDKFTLKQAYNGTEVIAYLEENENNLPGLIMLDLNMPIMDGKETLQWLKNDDRFKNIPAMVFTTSSREEDIKLCQSFNCTFFRKPTLYRDLLHIVQIMIGMYDKNKVASGM